MELSIYMYVQIYYVQEADLKFCETSKFKSLKAM